MSERQLSIPQLTSWLQHPPDIIAARIAHLIRQKGVDPNTVICAKIFPDIANPTGGVIITPKGVIYQFVYNRLGMVMEMSDIEEWTNITTTFMDHPWRDEILSGLARVDATTGDRNDQ